jgi:hypothetical protein
MIEGHDYTIYSNGPGGRARMYAFLAVITAFLTPLAQRASLLILRRYWGDEDIANAALFFGGFTALILFGILTSYFNYYLWRTSIGAWMFSFIGLSPPPNLNGEYRGTVELYSATDRTAAIRAEFFMRVSQTWEQICLLVEREAEGGGLVRLHSDMASVRLGMISGVVTLRFVYTFEESLPRREGVGLMARQFSGSATFEFRRDRDAWQVTGHFFDDIGQSGQVSLRQEVAGARSKTVAPPPPTAASSK